MKYSVPMIIAGMIMDINQARIALPQESVWRILIIYQAIIQPIIGINDSTRDASKAVIITLPKPSFSSGVPANLSPNNRKIEPMIQPIMKEIPISIMSAAIGRAGNCIIYTLL